MLRWLVFQYFILTMINCYSFGDYNYGMFWGLRIIHHKQTIKTLPRVDISHWSSPSLYKSLSDISTTLVTLKCPRPTYYNPIYLPNKQGRRVNDPLPHWQPAMFDNNCCWCHVHVTPHLCVTNVIEPNIPPRFSQHTTQPSVTEAHLSACLLITPQCTPIWPSHRVPLCPDADHRSRWVSAPPSQQMAGMLLRQISFIVHPLCTQSDQYWQSDQDWPEVWSRKSPSTEPMSEPKFWHLSL